MSENGTSTNEDHRQYSSLDRDKEPTLWSENATSTTEDHRSFSSLDGDKEPTSWFKGLIPRVIEYPPSDMGGLDNDYLSTNGNKSIRNQFQKSVSLNLSSEDDTKPPVTIPRRNSDTSTLSSSPLKRMRSLPIFPSLQMITGSRRGSLDSQGVQETNEEFDTSEMILFLSQGAK